MNSSESHFFERIPRCFRFISGYILVGLIFMGLSQPARCEASFPLKLSGNHRYLVDQKKVPFLIKEISCWGLIQALSEADAAEFMDSVKAKGFNTLMVSAISADSRFAGNPPNWEGNCPFLVKWDFSTPNEAYFAHVNRILKMAEKKGLLVLLVPCYLGYYGDPNQGWFNKLFDSKNSLLKSRMYGKFLGSRYKDSKNIVWMAGGDNSASGEVQGHMLNIIQGIKEGENPDVRHLWTGHWSSEVGQNWSTDNPPFAALMDLDGLYAFVEKDMGSAGPQYKSDLEKFKCGKMYFQMDQSYEQDIPGGPDNINYQWIRRKNYGGLLSGCAGTSFSPGIDKDKQLYKFYDWRSFMNTKGMHEAMHCFNLFESRAWHELIPDQNTSQIIKSGRGNFGEIDYACAAQTANGETIIVYLPTPRTITINMGQISPRRVGIDEYSARARPSLPLTQRSRCRCATTSF
jgi:hypothetical protein